MRGRKRELCHQLHWPTAPGAILSGLGRYGATPLVFNSGG